ncbi:hypothetical protein SLE2022_101790 [Rubroshorea leprosula]
MPPNRCCPLPRVHLCLKPLFISSNSSLSTRKFTIATQTMLANPRLLSSLAFAQFATDNGGRSGALSPPPISEEVQRIDVNPLKETRDFPPEDMCPRNWLFNHF